MISPLAHPGPHLQQRPPRPRDPIGLCVHTTGSGIVESARRAGADPLEWAVSYYLRPTSYHPHYVIGWDGAVIALCDEDHVAPHVGFAESERVAYDRPTWHRGTMAPWIDAWRPRGISSPLQLYPGSTPNRAFIGVELLPLEQAARAGGVWFSPLQHEAVADLAADIFARYALLPRADHLVGHEDLNPLRRWDAGGGWDPGARRARPRFDWPLVFSRLGIA